MGHPEKVRKPHFFGMLHVYRDPDGLDIYNPNAPNGQARMTIVNGGTYLRINKDAPRHFTIELQTHLDKLKTLLILGG